MLITKNLTKYIEKQELPSLFFHGLPGTSKTYTIRKLRDLIYPKDTLLYLEVNGSDKTKLDYYTNEISIFCKTEYISNINKKLLVIDEADSLNIDSQHYLYSLMKKYSNKVSFCIICNYQYNIIENIKSMCLKYFFKPHTLESYTNIIQLKYPDFTDTNDIEKIYGITKKDLRMGLNIVEILKNKDVDNIYHFLNYPDNNVSMNIYKILVSKIKLNTKYKKIKDIIQTNNILLSYLIEEILKIYLEEIEDYNPFIIEKISDIEYYLSKDGNHDLHLLSFISLF